MVRAARLMTLILGVSLFRPAFCFARWEVLVYFGKSWTLDSDVSLTTRPGTSLKLDQVSWEDESFQSPHYYGLRATYRPDDSPWGIALDFTHAKIYAERDQLVHVSGERGGVAVDERVPASSDLDHFNLSHGLNFLTLNAIYEWKLAAETEARAGLGLGLTIPHVEATIAGEREEAYQFGGFAAQGFVGLSRRFGERFSLVSEYKLGYADIDVAIGEKTRLHTAPWTHQLLLGPQLEF